jgi:maleylacetoacetate isomerase
MSTSTAPKLTLHTYFRSSCSARLRIALNLKSIPYESIYVNLLKDEQQTETYKKLNPSASVPALVIPASDSATQHTSTFAIGQSIAALEYLEEAYPNATPRLLPPISEPGGRAAVRSLVQIIASDVQPLTNMRVMRRVSAQAGGDQEAASKWARELMMQGFEAFEAAVGKSGGKYCVGDEMTLADVVLVPAVWGAERYGVEIGRYPKIKEVYERMLQEPAVQKAHWKNQEDTPQELRG